jgi:hypothetical protein
MNHHHCHSDMMSWGSSRAGESLPAHRVHSRQHSARCVIIKCSSTSQKNAFTCIARWFTEQNTDRMCSFALTFAFFFALLSAQSDKCFAEGHGKVYNLSRIAGLTLTATDGEAEWNYTIRYVRMRAGRKKLFAIACDPSHSLVCAIRTFHVCLELVVRPQATVRRATSIRSCTIALGVSSAWVPACLVVCTLLMSSSCSNVFSSIFYFIIIFYYYSCRLSLLFRLIFVCFCSFISHLFSHSWLIFLLPSLFFFSYIPC